LSKEKEEKEKEKEKEKHAEKAGNSFHVILCIFCAFQFSRFYR